MHIGSVALFDAKPLRTPEGGIDVDRIHRLVEVGMHRAPRYRQRIARVPFFDHPVWVDDPRFNLNYHLRHTHLPAPGDERQLKRLAGRIMSQQLDRGKPLWELWVVEGLEGDRFAVITKVHHCMIDGVGSVELVGAFMRPTPDLDPRDTDAPPRWVPRPAPTLGRLVLDEAMHRLRAPLVVAAAASGVVRDPRGAVDRVRDAVAGVRDVLSTGLRPASPSPFNVEIGPHRRFDWCTTELETVRSIRQAFGGTVNDVVLAILAGGLRRFLHRRGITVDELDFRAMIPVNVRPPGDRAATGNRVAMMVARLPLEARTPRLRLERVVDETVRAKKSHQASGMQALEEVSDVTFTALLTQFSRLTVATRPFNLIVTNVPGPPFPVYMLGARMTASWPLVPLFANQALGVALLSYDGRLHWGFNADWDVVPDLHDLVEAVVHEVDALAADAAAMRAAS